MQWRNLSAAAPANAGGPEGPEGAQRAPKGPTKMEYQICERLVNIECKTLKRVLRVVFTSDIQATVSDATITHITLVIQTHQHQVTAL